MIKDIEEDPFIPVAWQKAHSGMQGTEYFERESDIMDLVSNWEFGVRHALDTARMMNSNGATKQLINRVLEPYQWYTCIVTATEYDNFFELRCPQYEFNINERGEYVGTKRYKSRKDVIADLGDLIDPEIGRMSQQSDLYWLKLNKGAGEIHISLLAEAMYDAMNESTPNELKTGEWHIPFGDNLDRGLMGQYVPDFSTAPSEMENMFNREVDRIAIKVSVARCARVSYLNFEGKDDYEADIKLYDRLLAMGHMSPFEHCARAMNVIEYEAHIHSGLMNSKVTIQKGWSGNFRGFVQLRKEIE
jgi:hypothetical protein